MATKDRQIMIYTQKDLRKLYSRFKPLKVKDKQGYVRSISDFLKKTYTKPKSFLVSLVVCSDFGCQSYWWADPLQVMMYKRELEAMPLLINVPVYGEVSKWRLDIGK